MIHTQSWDRHRLTARQTALCAICLCLSAVLSCDRMSGYREIDFSKRLEAPAGDTPASHAPTHLTVAVSSTQLTPAAFAPYSALIARVADLCSLDVSMKYYRRYADLYRDFQAHRIDIGLTCSFVYALGKRDNLMQLLVAPVKHGSVTFRSVVIVPHGSPTRTFEELAGTRFAFTDNLSMSGYWFPMVKGGRGAAFWSKTVFSGSHAQSISLVNRGLVDGASVDETVLEQERRLTPQDTRNVRVIDSSMAYGMPPVVTSMRLDAHTRRKLAQAFLALDSDSIGRRLLSILEIERFTIVDDKLYASVAAMVPNTLVP